MSLYDAHIWLEKKLQIKIVKLEVSTGALQLPVDSDYIMTISLRIFWIPSQVIRLEGE